VWKDVINVRFGYLSSVDSLPTDVCYRNHIAVAQSADPSNRCLGT
jgi:hypothetical protein